MVDKETGNVLISVRTGSTNAGRLRSRLIEVPCQQFPAITDTVAQPARREAPASSSPDDRTMVVIYLHLLLFVQAALSRYRRVAVGV